MSLKYIYPEYILKIIYSGLIQPKLIYGLLLWWSSIDNEVKTLKNAIRAVTSSLFLFTYWVTVKKLFKTPWYVWSKDYKILL